MNSNFLTINELRNFNNRIMPLSESEEIEDIDDVGDMYNPVTVKPTKVKFESWLRKPEEIDETILFELSDIQDGKVTGDMGDFADTKHIGPDTVDMIKNSIAVAYITRDGIPVGFATVIDPTIENWKGIIPLSYYELKSGINLDGRLQQEFFIVSPQYDNYGLSKELRNQISKVSPMMFAAVPAWDLRSIAGLEKNEYDFNGEFDTTWEPYPVQLWTN